MFQDLEISQVGANVNARPAFCGFCPLLQLFAQLQWQRSSADTVSCGCEEIDHCSKLLSPF